MQQDRQTLLARAFDARDDERLGDPPALRAAIDREQADLGLTGIAPLEPRRIGIGCVGDRADDLAPLDGDEHL